MTMRRALILVAIILEILAVLGLGGPLIAAGLACYFVAEFV